MKKSLCVFAVLVAAAFGRQWVPLDAGRPEVEPGFRVLSSDRIETVVELELGGIYVDEVEAGDRTWQTIELGIAAGGLTWREGEPQLPVVARFLRIPDDRAVRVEVLAFDEVRLAGYRVLPVQPPQVEEEPAGPFVIDEGGYATDEFYPAASWEASEPMIMRDLRLAQLVLKPVAFNPVSGELSVARRLRVRLVYDRPGTTNLKLRRRSGVSRAFEPLYRRLVANYDFGPPQRPEDGSYLIITHDNFAGAVEPFAAWKKRRGWRTRVVTTSEIGGSDSARVYSYIRNAYNNWPYPPDYVLLVGDAPGYIACCHQTSAGYAASDLPYSCMEGGDLLADLMIGRVSAQTATEAQTCLNKLYRFEKEPYTGNTEWFNKVCALAAYESSPRFWSVVIRIRNYVMGRPFVQFDTLFQRWGLNTASGLTDSLNLGRAWMLYRGHGLKTGWGNVSPSWSNSNVNALANGRMTPIVIGPTCDAGDFDYTSDCHAEAWLKAGTPDTPKGGAGYFGSSEPSYSGYNDTLALGCFMSYVDSLLFTFGQSTQFGKLLMLSAYPLPDPTSIKELWMFNNIGEPELNLWSSTPKQLAVDHPATVLIGSFPFAVTVTAQGGPVRNALVCAMSRADTTLYHVGYTNAAGQAQFTLNASVPGDTILVTVTGRNLLPYLAEVRTIAPNCAYVTYLRHRIDDPAPGGNNDSIVNPGETVSVPLWVKNWGAVSAASVTGTLRTASQGVTVLDSVRPFGTIAPAESAAAGSGGFRFSVAGSCTNGHLIDFQLACRDANDSVWRSGFSLQVGAPVLEYVEYLVSDPPPGGNGDGKLDPGETAELSVVLRNRGLGHGYGIAGLLRSADVRLQMEDSLGTYGTIRRDTTGSNSVDRFRVRADNSIPREARLPCALLVSGQGYSDTLSFEVVVGAIRAIDPIPDGPRQPSLYWAYDDRDSTYDQRPTYNWVEIKSNGTRLSFANNDAVIMVNLPSAFGPLKYYGQRFTQISISADGWIAPGNYTTSNFTNTNLPSSSAPPGAICFNWDDLYPGYSSAGYAYWYHDAANNRFIVEFDSAAYYDQTSVRDKFEVIFYDTTLAAPDGNTIFDFQYMTANRYTSNTVGIQDPTRAIGIQALFNGSYHNGCWQLGAQRAIRFTTDLPTGVVEATGERPMASRRPLVVTPNPFRRTSTVRWNLGQAGNAELRVFDASGRAVRTLVSGRLEAGSHTMTWDGTDDMGRRLAHGIYFVRLATPETAVEAKTVVAD